MKPDLAQIERLLSQDRVWSAYALADLDPAHQNHCTWALSKTSVLLMYTGLEPAVLFLSGATEEIPDLLGRIPGGHYQFSCLPNHLDALHAQLEVESETEMWRMSFDTDRHPSAQIDAPVTILDGTRMADIQTLFDGHADAPDAFKATQLDDGTFFGICDGSKLVAIAGTHVLSRTHRLAAVGNVFTAPAYRGRGYATLTTRAVVHQLMSQGIETIVLNVVKENEAAIKAYQRIGFSPYCEYYEGHARTIKR